MFKLIDRKRDIRALWEGYRGRKLRADNVGNTQIIGNQKLLLMCSTCSWYVHWMRLSLDLI